MSFFNKFPKTEYNFGDLNDLTTIPNIFRQVKVYNKDLNAASSYEYYRIDQERPDQLSQLLYGTTDFYWTFFVINDHLRDGMSAWPADTETMHNLLDTKYQGYTFTPYRELTLPDPLDYNSISGKFPIGATLVGSTSGATGVVTDRKPNINQIVFTLDEGSPQFLSNEKITGLFDGVESQVLDKHIVNPYKYSVERYIDSTTNEEYSNHQNLNDVNDVFTYEQFENALNDTRSNLRVLHKDNIEDFAITFRRVING